jgi:hypothetical protein
VIYLKQAYIFEERNISLYKIYSILSYVVKTWRYKVKKMTLFKGKISKWSMISRISIFILMFLMYSAIEAKGKASVWRSECIDCPKSFSAYQRSIALDSLNRPHMAYGLDHLYHAYYDGMEWKYETVDSLDGVGEFASLAIDSQDCVHIVYHDGKNNALKYATNSSGSWSIVTVVSSGIAYPFSSMVLDSQGKVHISYIDDFDKYLM